MTSRTSAGFTLIEVMITVGIVAILAAIAIPAYSTYATRGRIPEATVGLGARQVDMEQYFQDNRKYASAAPACTDDGESKFFTFSCTGITDTTFTLVATGKGAMSGFTFNVNQANLKTTAAVPSGWSQPSPNNCWVRNKGGVC
ncbi:MAG TPA: type IV pilin protein [Solimonas sp.]